MFAFRVSRSKSLCIVPLQYRYLYFLFCRLSLCMTRVRVRVISCFFKRAGHTIRQVNSSDCDDLDPKAINSTAAAARCTATSTNVQACSSDVMSMTSHSSHVHSLQSQTTDIRVIIEHMQIPVIQLQDRHAFPLVSSLSILFLLLE